MNAPLPMAAATPALDLTPAQSIHLAQEQVLAHVRAAIARTRKLADLLEADSCAAMHGACDEIEASMPTPAAGAYSYRLTPAHWIVHRNAPGKRIFPASATPQGFNDEGAADAWMREKILVGGFPESWKQTLYALQPIMTPANMTSIRDRVMAAAGGQLREAYTCSRTWSAWSAGTMSEQDFQQACDDHNLVSAVADAVLQELPGPLPPPVAPDQFAPTREGFEQFIVAKCEEIYGAPCVLNRFHDEMLGDTYKNHFVAGAWMLWQLGVEPRSLGSMQRDEIRPMVHDVHTHQASTGRGKGE